MSSKDIYTESKHRLIDKVHNNLNAITQIHKQISKGSKSPEVCSSSTIHQECQNKILFYFNFQDVGPIHQNVYISRLHN